MKDSSWIVRAFIKLGRELNCAILSYFFFVLGLRHVWKHSEAFSDKPVRLNAIAELKLSMLLSVQAIFTLFSHVKNCYELWLRWVKLKACFYGGRVLRHLSGSAGCSPINWATLAEETFHTFLYKTRLTVYTRDRVTPPSRGIVSCLPLPSRPWSDERRPFVTEVSVYRCRAHMDFWHLSNQVNCL